MPSRRIGCAFSLSSKCAAACAILPSTALSGCTPGPARAQDRWPSLKTHRRWTRSPARCLSCRRAPPLPTEAVLVAPAVPAAPTPSGRALRITRLPEKFIQSVSPLAGRGALDASTQIKRNSSVKENASTLALKKPPKTPHKQTRSRSQRARLSSQ